MNLQLKWKIGLFAILSLGICACTTSTSSGIDDEYYEELSKLSSSTQNQSKNKSSSSTSTKSSSSQSTNSSDSSTDDSSTESALCSEDASPTDICFNESTPTPSPIPVTRTTLFDTPKVSAVIFHWDSDFEFEIVVDGNYTTYALMEANNIDSLVYQFKWNDEDPKDWRTVRISKLDKSSNSKSVPFTTHAKKIMKDVKELCKSYAAARIIWTDMDGEIVSTEWSDPVGPLYTLTMDNDARTTFAYGLDGANPCQ